MADSDVKAMTENLEAETFDEIAFTTPVPLNKAKVAIVTSASLHHPTDEDFSPWTLDIAFSSRNLVTM